MKQKEFMDRLNLCFKTNKKDTSLLTSNLRTLRASLLFNNLNILSKILSFFDFKDNIIIENGVPFIIIDNIKFILIHQIYLKHTGNKYVSACTETINFLDNFNIRPKNIIDLGACWGEFSLFLGKRFPDCNIFSIEGSEKNFEVLNINLNNNLGLSTNIKPFNLIISENDGFEEISNSLSTTNTLKNVLNKEDIKYKKVNSSKLKSFINNNNLRVDFLKIDIEGSEIKLLSDLKIILPKSIQVELINYNSIEANLYFLEELSEFYNFYDPEGWVLINIRDLKEKVKKRLIVEPIIDVFMVNKNYK